MTDLAAELRRLQREDGRLLPEDVVDAARDPDSPLHGAFTWDDSEAAAKHRLAEARALIRRVRLEVTIRDMPISVPAYVRDPDADANQRGYVETARLRTDEDAARSTIISEMKRVADAVRRAKAIAAVLGAAEDVAQIETIARGVMARIEAGTESSNAEGV